MKLIFSYILVLVSLAAFGQEREPLELPTILNQRILHLPECELPKVDRKKEARYYRVKSICVFTYQAEVSISGLPANYEGLTFDFYKSMDANRWAHWHSPNF